MKTFRTAIIDPPWPYGKGTGAFQGTPDTSVDSQVIYRTMSMKDIENLPIAQLGLEYTFLWTGQTFLTEAVALLKQWGTPYCSNLVWYKGNLTEGSGSIGTWFRSGHEVCLFGHRAKVPTIRSTFPTAFPHPRLKHSAKPDNLHTFIEGLGTDGKHTKNKDKIKTPCAYPGPYLEIFGRKARAGWTVIGNEAPETRGEDVKLSLQKFLE